MDNSDTIRIFKFTSCVLLVHNPKPVTYCSFLLYDSIDALVTLQCQNNYYGSNCATFCNASRSGCGTGFYTCSSSGAKQCVNGWSGTDCETHDGATCASGGTIYTLRLVGSG